MFVTGAVTDSTEMFSGCTSIEGGNHTIYSGDHIDKEYARIDGYNGLPGYFWHKLGDAYAIHFDKNASVDVVTNMPEDTTKQYGVDLLIAEIPQRADCTFLGWSVSPIATSPTYLPGDYCDLNASATLYAVWKLNYSQYIDGIALNTAFKVLAGNPNRRFKFNR